MRRVINNQIYYSHFKLNDACQRFSTRDNDHDVSRSSWRCDTFNEGAGENISHRAGRFNSGLRTVTATRHRHRYRPAVSVARATPVSRCAKYFRNERARRDYRNMRVKRTLPPRPTTVVKHEDATEGGEDRARRESGRLLGGGVRGAGEEDGGCSRRWWRKSRRRERVRRVDRRERERRLQRVRGGGGGSEEHGRRGWLLVKGSMSERGRGRVVRE